MRDTKGVFTPFLLMVFAVYYSRAEINNTTDEESIIDYDPSQSYCFQFTWLGPEFNNETEVNTTCAEILEDKRVTDVPCRHPLLITDNSAPPDINYLWENHRDRVLCRRVGGNVCVKYTYKFDDQIQNQTHMCTKVSTPGKGAVDSGCYTQTVDGHDVELCVCLSTPGAGKPCNSVTHNVAPTILLVLLCCVVLHFSK
ncbi:hypothetical protein FQA39_LY12602 [Lamprigera yunnana]|nr:hypothetical protein FQA39_LY12602 [Lamprigera yunnana]